VFLELNNFLSKSKKWFLAFILVIGAWLWLPDLWQPKLPAFMSEELLREKIKTHRISPAFSLQYERKFAEFGKMLFLDPRLSANGQVSCSTCHNPGRSFTDGRPTAFGMATTERNTPTLVNIALNSWFFSDGRADSLTAQAMGPWLDPREQGLSKAQLATKIMALYSDAYTSLYGPLAPEALRILRTKTDQPDPTPQPAASLLPQFMRMYGIATIGSFSALDDILKLAGQRRLSPQDYFALLSAGLGHASDKVKEAQNEDTEPSSHNDVLDQLILDIISHSAAALEAYQRTILATQSPFDRFAARVEKTSTMQEAFDDHFGEEEFQGLNLFMGKGKCDLCHLGPNFSDSQFHNIGLPWRPEADDIKLPSGRAQGLQSLGQHPFSCKTPHVIKARKANKLPDLETCIEVDYLKLDALESMSAFKTPTLRNLKSTAPYMHDGRFHQLEDVIDHYSSLPGKPAIGHREETLKDLNLTRKEKDHLIKFLSSLDSQVESL